jgi:hypothetical protein
MRPMESRAPMISRWPIRRAHRGLLTLSRASRLVCALTGLSLMLWGCVDSGREGPFLTAQLCVRDEAGMAQLIDELRAVATARDMRFFDYSADTERSLANVGHPARDDGSPVVYVGVDGGDGLGVRATNVGLPGYQVALGFTEGRDRLETQSFTDEVIERLERHWQVERLPAGTGALPQPGCR